MIIYSIHGWCDLSDYKQQRYLPPCDRYNVSDSILIVLRAFSFVYHALVHLGAAVLVLFTWPVFCVALGLVCGSPGRATVLFLADLGPWDAGGG